MYYVSINRCGSNPPFLLKNILRGGLEEVPAQSHKLNDAGSSPAPATMNGSITQLVEHEI